MTITIFGHKGVPLDPPATSYEEAEARVIIEAINETARAFLKKGLAMPVIQIRHNEMQRLKAEMKDGKNCQIKWNGKGYDFWVMGCKVEERNDV